MAGPAAAWTSSARSARPRVWSASRWTWPTARPARPTRTSSMPVRPRPPRSACSGCTGGFDINTDVRDGIIELKWLYTEFEVPLIPVPTVVRIGAQPFGGAASYKLAAYATGDFAGLNVVTTITPNVKINFTYVQVEEALSGSRTHQTAPELRRIPATASSAAMTSPSSWLPRSPRSRASTSSRCTRTSTPAARRAIASRHGPRRREHDHRVHQRRRHLEGRDQREPPHGGSRRAAAAGAVLAGPDPDVPVRSPRRRRAGYGRGRV